ncbi:hypothetical protein EFD62_17030 [Acetivibrio mesophilus]|uniref:Uncharacterized protein n=1 Tax=Acetivibrio mesophilus TaxID=2487273 RepID=A0A4Q0I046_9FIRM|nr:hypothetical protein A7W90_08010 [Clostridium sp. Bc-iso-3]RXE57564.1 hypothetical protein EFD62_17030 [Acetivibrio mesophilus]
MGPLHFVLLFFNNSIIPRMKVLCYFVADYYSILWCGAIFAIRTADNKEYSEVVIHAFGFFSPMV